METIQTREIDVAAIHDIERAGFERKMIERVDIMQFSLGNVDKTRNVAAQIDKRMELDRGFVFAEFRPGEKTKAEVNGGGIERVDGFFQPDAEWIMSV